MGRWHACSAAQHSSCACGLCLRHVNLGGTHRNLHLHRNCTSTPAYYNRENTRTSSPLLSPQRLSVSSSMTPGRRARARRARLDRRLKVPDGERRSGPAPVISCEGPGAAPPRAHIRGLPGRPPMLPVSLLCPLSQHLCALNQGPLTRYLLSFQMTSMALPCLEAPPAFVRGENMLLLPAAET